MKTKTITKEMVIERLVKYGVNPKDATEAVNANFDIANRMYYTIKVIADFCWANA